MKQAITFIISLLSFSLAAQKKDSIRINDTANFRKKVQLQEVIVQSRKRFIDVQIDKTVMNVQNDLVASTGNAFEVLQQAPGVSIVNDETISMLGKAGVTVLIDGRPTQLSGRELAVYLKSMPASNIDKIEIITNPSSRFDAQGNAGIINIRLKKNTAKGTNGNISSSYTQSDHYRVDLSANINHRRGKWNWFGSMAVNKNLQHTIGAINRKITANGITSLFENHTIDVDQSKGYNFRLGADFYVSAKSTLGFLMKSNKYFNPMFTPGNTIISTNGFIDSVLINFNDNQTNSLRNNYNLNYRFTDTAGTELNIDADLVNFNNHNSSAINTDFYNRNNAKYGLLGNYQQVNTSIVVYTLKADYTKEWKKAKAKIEIGFKTTNTQTSNNIEASFLQNQQKGIDTGRSNRFNYLEKIHAAYASFNQQLGKFSYQIGLRAEQTIARGNSIDLRTNTIEKPDTNYLNIFPTIFIQYKLNKQHTLGMSYGRRVNRPTFQDLNPFEYQYDHFSSYKGNPYLFPEFTTSVEIKYSYKNGLNIAAGYSNTSNYFQSISIQTGDKTQASEFNVGNEYRYFLNLSLGMPITKWWDTYNNLTPFYKLFKGNIPSGVIDNMAFGMGWYSSQQFNLGKGYRFQLSSWGNMATQDAIFNTKWLGSVNLGAGKSFAKDKIGVKLTVTDIFNNSRWFQQVQFANMDYTYRRKWESRGVRVQLTYKIGKTNYKQRERTVAAETELNRIK